MEDLNTTLAQMLQRAGVNPAYVDWGARALVAVGIFVVSWLALRLFRHLLVPMLQTIAARTKTVWDDHLFDNRVMRRAGKLIPPLFWFVLLPLAFGDMPRLLHVLQKGCVVYLIVVSLLLLRSFLDSLYALSNRHETLRNRPLKGVYQMVQLIAVCIGCVLIVSILIDRDATTVLAGLGASAAVLMLIFRDSILGLVAGVQLSANDMLRPGDWITIPRHGADGYVIEVTLTTVKIQNFDKTITTVPPYALVSDSFQNWRGMRESGGRRIKRALLIDAGSVRFCTEQEIARLRENYGIEPTDRPAVNLQLFRNYISAYLTSHPDIHPDLLRMVRMLQPTAEGIPIEIYCFSRTVEWLPYEALQSAVFDHLLAVLPEFGLRVYQRPSSSDLYLHAVRCVERED